VRAAHKVDKLLRLRKRASKRSSERQLSARVRAGTNDEREALTCVACGRDGSQEEATQSRTPNRTETSQSQTSAAGP
jgi:hypothetical protein